jgi:hypothetical protein
MGLATAGIFDGIHEGKALAHLRQGNPEIPALEKATRATSPVVAAVGCLEEMQPR